MREPKVQLPKGLSREVIGWQEVSFTAISERKRTERNEAACYGTIMNNVVGSTIICQPLNANSVESWYDSRGRYREKRVRDDKVKSPFPGREFLALVELLKENNICPSQARATVEGNQNILRLPAGAGSGPQRYATLCFYRWSEAAPSFAYTLVKLSQRYKKRLDFFQILHYCLHRFDIPSEFGDHSFVSDYLPAGRTFNPVLGLAMAKFFRQRRMPNLKSGRTGHLITQTAETITPMEKAKYGGKRLRYVIRKATDALDPRLTPLFKKPRLSMNNVQQTLSEMDLPEGDKAREIEERYEDGY